MANKKPNNNNINQEIIKQFHRITSRKEQLLFSYRIVKTTIVLLIRSYIPRQNKIKNHNIEVKQENLSPDVIDLNQQHYSYEQIEKFGIVKQKGKRGLTDVSAYFTIIIQTLLTHKYGFDNIYLQLLESNAYYAKQLVKIKKIYKYNYCDKFTFFELIQFIQKIPNKGRILDLSFERLNYTQIIE